MDNVPVNTILPTQQESGGDSTASSGGPTETTSGVNPFVTESITSPERLKTPEKTPNYTTPRTEVLEEKLDTIKPYGAAASKTPAVVDKRKEKERLHPTHSASDPVTNEIAKEEGEFIERQESAHEQPR